jgi:hypothetical protein
MPETYTVYELAQRAAVRLTSDQSRLISAALCQIAQQKSLTVDEKRHTTSKPNPKYKDSPKQRKNIGQSYFVKAFDASLEYYFKQLCILLIDTP